MPTTYTGPKNIVILGGGLAGLAAADAITEALLAQPDPLPAGLTVTVLEADDGPGGRTISRSLDDPTVRAQHPHAPYGTSAPHGLHFIWGSYEHLFALCHATGLSFAPPAGGTSTYCAWLAPPDVPGGEADPAHVVAIHVCDPANPRSAWQPRARHVLSAFRDGGPAVTWLEAFFKRELDLEIRIADVLSYMDILFATDTLAPELRWILFAQGAAFPQLGMPEDSPVLRAVLGGRSPTDADIGVLMKPLFDKHFAPRVAHVHDVLRSMAGALDGGTPVEPSTLLGKLVDEVFGTVVTDVEGLANAALAKLESLVSPGSPAGHVAAFGQDVVDGASALADFLTLMAHDAAEMVARGVTYDPGRSGYLKNVLKAAFSSPYGLDVGTTIRDAQFGVRDYAGAVLQVFDGDGSRAIWQAIRDRIATRFGPGKLAGGYRTGAWARRIVLAGTDRAVTGVEVATTATVAAPCVPTVRAAAIDPIATTLPADVVVSTLMPQSLAPLLGDATTTDQQAFLENLRTLALRMNETVNLQLFFPGAHTLPFADPPAGTTEQRPFGISNLEGPFTIVVDLARAWSPAAFGAIRLNAADPTPFQGSAWELVGAWADLFTHDALAHAGRFQWPLAVRQELAALMHDPADFDPATIDARAWVHDAGPDAVKVVMGEVLSARAAAYAARFLDQATPIIVAGTLRQLAAMPGVAPATRAMLEAEAANIAAGQPTQVRYTLSRNCHAENKFFSAEPGLFALRPYARFPTPVPGLWASGDWTRNGLNLQCMEAAVISGLQSACGVIERIRVGGLAQIRPPAIDPDILPAGAWDTGE